MVASPRLRWPPSVVDGFGLWCMGRPTNEQQETRRRELNEKQLAFAIWFATVPELRVPGSLSEFAEVVGVSRQTIWKWERDPRVTEAVRYLTLQNSSDPLKVGQILDMLHAEALEKKSGKLAEVWLRATGVMSQFNRTSGLLDWASEEQGEFADFSLEELEALRAQHAAAKTEDAVVAKAAEILAK